MVLYQKALHSLLPPWLTSRVSNRALRGAVGKHLCTNHASQWTPMQLGSFLIAAQMISLSIPTGSNFLIYIRTKFENVKFYCQRRNNILNPDNGVLILTFFVTMPSY